VIAVNRDNVIIYRLIQRVKRVAVDKRLIKGLLVSDKKAFVGHSDNLKLVQKLLLHSDVNVKLTVTPLLQW
jgi:hypothetical protein